MRCLICMLAIGFACGALGQSSVDDVVGTLYQVISGPAHQKRDWDKLRALFTPDARMIVVYQNKAGEAQNLSITVEEYIKDSEPLMESKGFFEREISRKAEQFGGIAQVFSTYESRYKSDDKLPFERGINSLQLVQKGNRWLIASVTWQGEDAAHPLPARYLKN